MAETLLTWKRETLTDASATTLDTAFNTRMATLQATATFCLQSITNYAKADGSAFYVTIIYTLKV